MDDLAETGSIPAEVATSIPSIESRRGTESRDSREAILNAFEDAFSAFENFPEDKLTPEQISARDLIRSVREKTKDNPLRSYLNKFEGEDGKKYSQKEYLPTDKLMTWLVERVRSGELSPDERAKYLEQALILHRNSPEYYRGRIKKEAGRKMARIRQEAERISSDPNLTTGDPHEDFLKAQDELFARRELILPTDAVKPPIKPPPPPIKEVSREFAIGNRTLELQKRSREIAEHQLREEMRRGSAWNPLNWPRKIALRVAEEFYRQRFTERAYTAMLANNNSLLDINVVRNEIRDANNQRAQHEAEGQVKIEQIKTGEELEGQTVFEAEGALKAMMLNEIIRPAVEGGITDVVAVQERLREFVQAHVDDPDLQVRNQIREVFGPDTNQYGRIAEYFATDLLEVAGAVREDLSAHKYAIEALDRIVKIKLFNTSWAAETQVQFNAADRFVRWVERSRLRGWLLNPATIGAGFSFIAFITTRAVGWGGRGAQAFVPGAGLLAGAAAAGFRRNYDLKVDMASHQVERAYGADRPANAPRREALENFAYNTASVNDLLNGEGQDLLTGTDRLSIQELLRQDLTQATSCEDVIRRISEIKTRLNFSATEHVDLVTFGGREQVEQGRLQLIKAVVEVRAALRRSGMSDNDISSIENNFNGQWNGRFIQNREQQDRLFRNYRIRNAIGSGVFASVAGLGMGLLSQEVLAEGGRKLFGISSGPTVLENAKDWIGERLTPSPAHAEALGGMPHDFNINTFRGLFQNPGNRDFSLPTGEKFTIAVGPETYPVGHGQPNELWRSLSILDENGKRINTPPLHLTTDGKIISFGSMEEIQKLVPPDQLPSFQRILNALGIEPSQNAWFDARKDIADMLITGRHDTFMHGNLSIDINPDPTQPGLMSMTNEDTGEMFIGEAKLIDGVVQIDIDPDHFGNMNLTEDSFNRLKSELTQDAWKINSETIPGVDKQVDVNEYLTEKGELSPTSRDVWHDNDTPMRKINGRWIGADGKELQFHHRVLPDGRIELDFSNMESQLRQGKWVNWDFSVDNQYNRVVNDIISQPDGTRVYQNFEIMITPNEAANDLRQAMVFSSDTHPEIASGKLWIDPGSETARMFFQLDENGKPVLNPFGNFQIASYIEVAHLQGSGLRSVLATTQGLGVDQFHVQTPPHEIYHLNPPGAVEFTPPIVPPLENPPPPIIPIPFAPRHPLEPLRINIPIPDGGYPFGYEHFRTPEGRWARFSDLIRFHSEKDRTDQRITNKADKETEGEKALAAIRETFLESPHVYLGLSGAIGDIVVTSAYIDGLRKYIEKLGLKKDITLILPDNVVPLVEPLAKEYGYEIIAEERAKTVEQAKSLINSRNETNAIVFQFDHRNGNPTLEFLPENQGLVLSDLLFSSVGLYTNNRAGDSRFSQFLSEILSMPDNEKVEARPHILLPENHEEIFERLKNEYNLDLSKKQITIVPEASYPMKRYSLNNWREIMLNLKNSYPDAEFNIAYNPDTSVSGYTKEELERNFDGIEGVRFINNRLSELSIFLSRQDLVLSNDTGIAHMAATIEGDPKVITLHIPLFPPDVWVTNSNRHKGLLPRNEDLTNNFDSEEKDEKKKWINKIKTAEVISEALEVLRNGRFRPLPRPERPNVFNRIRQEVRQNIPRPNIPRPDLARVQESMNNLQSQMADLTTRMSNATAAEKLKLGAEMQKTLTSLNRLLKQAQRRAQAQPPNP